MIVTQLTDFSDRLSPMLVKELRQGMRARGFTILFLVFQLMLAFFLITAGSANDSESAGSFASGVIFTIFTIAVLLIQPMRGLAALSSEIKENTIEMMALTRLTASRIVLGKWIAIVSQSALLLVTIVPYLILRYFYGGMMLVSELVILALIFLTSMAFTAVTVGLSGTSTKIVRGLPVLAFLWMLSSLPTLLYGSRFSGVFSAFTLESTESRIALGVYLCFIAYYGWCALSYGISAIAPIAENHSTPRRVVALVLACIAAGVAQHPAMDQHVTLAIFGFILAPAIIIAITERSILLPPVCQPFLRRGLLGRCASLFLLPGWAAGAFFTALLLGVSFCSTYLAVDPTNVQVGVEVWTVCLTFCGSVIFPAMLSALMTKTETKRFTNFVIFTLASVALAILVGVFAHANDHESYLWLFIWNPPVILALVDERSVNESHLLTAAILVNVLYLTVLLVKAAFAFRGYRSVFREAQDGLGSKVTPSLP